MSTIKGTIVEESEPYLAGIKIALEVDPAKYTRLLELQQLARENGYPDTDWGAPSHEQILFILGVCDRFREYRQKASANWLDLEVLEGGGE